MTRPTSSHVSAAGRMSLRAGNAASPADSSTARVTATSPMRERLPKHAHGWPPRPSARPRVARLQRTPSTVQPPRSRPGRRRRRRDQVQLDCYQRPPNGRAQPRPRDAERAQRQTALSPSNQLGARSGKKGGGQGQTQNVRCGQSSGQYCWRFIVRRTPPRSAGLPRELVAGSGIEFKPRGVRQLKGIGAWPLYAVVEA